MNETLVIAAMQNLPVNLLVRKEEGMINLTGLVTDMVSPPVSIIEFLDTRGNGHLIQFDDIAGCEFLAAAA